jgi:hypothetical protein
MVYSGLAYLIVLALVAQFVLSSKHSVRTRLLVAGAYALTLLAGYLLPALAVLLALVALGIALIFVYRWEHPKSSFL